MISESVQVALIVTVIPTILQFINNLFIRKVFTKLDAVHEDVNGSLAAMRAVELKAERVIGIAEGRELEKAERKEQ